MSNTNAKEEFIEEIEDRTVLCSAIQYGYNYYEEGRKAFSLPVGFSPDQYNDFLSSLDFEYDSGYGGQELHGLIWYQDGTWSERGEYDGSEWWDYKARPDIPATLNPVPMKESP